jgi:hypothetical protein
MLPLTLLNVPTNVRLKIAAPRTNSSHPIFHLMLLSYLIQREAK